MTIVADASPLIALAQIGRLDLMLILFTDLLIPPAILDEISRTNKPYSTELVKFATPFVKQIQNTDRVLELCQIVDRGEAEAIALALENLPTNLLIDERKGRRIAIEHGLSIIGSIGILLRAKQMGQIEAIKPYLDHWMSTDYRIGAKLYLRGLSLANELN